MGSVGSFLADWSIRFLENKDAIKREIIKIEENREKFDFIVHYKGKARYFIIKPTLENSIFDKTNDNGYFGLVTLNNLANIRFVVNEWKRLINFKFLNIYFINPFSSSDKVWIISPYIHDKVCDKPSLELGLKAIAEMVSPIGLKELSNKVKLLRGESGL